MCMGLVYVKIWRITFIVSPSDWCRSMNTHSWLVVQCTLSMFQLTFLPLHDEVEQRLSLLRRHPPPLRPK